MVLSNTAGQYWFVLLRMCGMYCRYRVRVA